METWVLSHSNEQDAYHIETLADYESKPRNGYKIVFKSVSRKEVEDESQRRIEDRNRWRQ